MPKTDPIDISSPASTSSPKQGDDTIRTLARAVIEILSKDHYVGSANANSQYDEDAAGEHAKVTLNAPLEADPAPGANKGALYIKDVGGVAELFFQDEDGTAIQLTDGGVIKGASVRLANNVALRGRNVAGDDDVAIVKVNATDEIEIPAALKVGGKITNVTDPTEDQDAATKKYVDDAIPSQFTPSSYAGEESVILPNGLIMKFGKDTTHIGNHTGGVLKASVSFGTAFPNSILNVQAQPIEENELGDMVWSIDSVSKTGFSYSLRELTSDHQNMQGVFWFAIGY